MRVVQWNTHHGGVPVDSSGNNKPLNVQGITDWLVKFNPDYVSLNELEQNDSYGNLDQLEHHRAALESAQNRKWYSNFCQMTGGATNKGIGVGLLSTTPFVSFIRKGLFGARPLAVGFTDFGYLATTHPDPDSATKRSTENAQILSLVYPQITKQVVCGDFNAVPTSVEMAPWINLYKDAWTEATKIGKATSFKPQGITHGVHRIDYIFYHGFDIVSADVPDTSVDGVFPSDHSPLVVEFK
jgi:endonuclease/exonuclease/phosphatase family metal-dependent hydrolase